MEGHRPARDSIDEMESLAQQLKRERDLTIRLLRLTNSPDDLHGLMRETTKLLQEWSGCTAVGIRLRDGDDFPYFETRGFPAEFVQAENFLCVTDVNGQIVRDNQGNPVLECMCGNVLFGRFDSALPFFTSTGNFWTNSTSELLATTTEADRQTRTRNRCHGEGYESVALISLRSDGVTFGLLQLNDHHAGRFTPQLIAALETLAPAIAEAIARRLAVEQLEESRNDLREQMDKVKESERNLRGLLAAVDQSVMLLEPDGTIRDCNQTFAARLGYSREELLGQDVYGLLPSEVAEQRKQRVEEVQRQRSAVSFVDERWGRRMAHRIVPILDDNDCIARFAVQGADITDQSRLAKDLQASNELLDAIKDAQALFIANRDPKAVFTGLLGILVNFTQSEYGFLDEVVCQDERPILKRSLAISDISWDEESRKLYEELAKSNFIFLNLENLAGAPAVSGEVVIANDPGRDRRSQGVPQGHPPVESFLGIPMRYGDEVVGVAGVANRSGGYTTKIAEFLEPLTSACAAMIVALRAQREAEEAQEALRRSENHFKLLYEQAPLGYQSLDVEGRFLDVNQAWLDLLGYTREEVLGRSFAEFLVPEERPLFEQRFPLFKEVGTLRGAEFKMVQKNGTSILVSIDGRIARDELGRFTQTHCILHDITAQKQSESLLNIERDLAIALTAADSVRQVIRSSLDAAIEATGLECGGVYLLDPDANTFRLRCHTGFSPDFCEATAAYTWNSEQGQMVQVGRFFQIDDEILATPPYTAASQEGLKSVAVMPVLHEGRAVGSMNIGSRTAHRSTSSVRKALEVIAAQMAIALSRSQSAEALRCSQAELRAIYDSSPHMMCVIDGQRRLLYMNRAMADFVGKSEDELRNQQACGIVGCVNALEDPRGCGYGHECESCSLRQVLKETLETGRSHRNVERHMTVAGSDGRREVVLLGSTSLIRSAAGVTVLLTLEDVTELRRSHMALQEAQQVRDAILGHTHMSAVFLDAKFNFVWVNQAYADTCNHDPDFFPGKNHFGLYPHEENQAIFQRVVDTGEPFTVTARPFVFSDQPGRGVTYWDWSLVPVKDDDGKTAGLVFTLAEVTEQKEAANELEAAHRNLEAIWSIASLADENLHDIQEHVVDTLAHMTQSPLSFFGLLSADESKMTVPVWSGNAMEDCSIHDRPREFSIGESGIWAEAVRQRKPLTLNDYTAEHPAKAGYPQGHVPLARLLVVPIMSHDRIVSVVAVANREDDYSDEDVDQVTAFMSGVHSVIERKQAKEALQESEHRLRELAANIPGAVYQFVRHSDGSYEVPFLSEGATTLLDRPLEILQDPARLFENVHPEDLEKLWASVEETATTLAPWRHEFRILREDGEQTWVRGASMPRTLADGGICWNGVLLDITERRLAEEALRESEGRVRAKLGAILEPDGDIGSLSLSDIIDVPAVEEIMDHFYRLTRFPVGILDLEGNVLVATGWQDVCTKFHRTNPVTAQNCLASDTQLSQGIERGCFRLYKCKNNMWDMATPIVIGGNHVGNLFFGQFLLDDEELDEDMIRNQARQYGFDEEGYLAAFARVPRWTRETAQNTMDFYARLANLISSLSYSNIRLARLLEAHKRVGESLRDAMLRQEAAVRAGDIGLWDWDLATNRVAYSAEWKRQIGYEEHEISDAFDEWQTRVHPEDLDAVLPKLQEFVNDEVPGTEVEFRFHHKDGSYRWILSRASIIQDEDGRPIRIMGSHVDLTERKWAEEALRKSEELFRKTFDEAPIGTAIVSLDHRFERVNAALCRITGYDAEELVARTFDDITHPDDLVADSEQAQKLADGVIDQYSMDKRYIRKDGKIAWVHLSVRSLNNQAGQPRGFLSMIVDITDRKHMETVIRDSEALLTQAEEIVGMGSFIWDVTSDDFSSSRGMHRLYGLNAHEFPNSFRDALLQLIHPQDQDRIRDEADRMVAERRAWPVEFRIVRSDGQERLIHCESQAFLGPDGQAIRYVGTVHDITCSRADEDRFLSMQLQLHHASRLAVMGELAAGVAHEVNQPLCSIVNFAKACQNVISREPANLDQIRQWTASINTAATRAGDIVHGLLKFARRHGADWESTAVRNLIDDAVLLVRHDAKLQAVVLHTELPEEDVAIEVQPGQIQQVLVNLLRNGIEALSSVLDGEKKLTVTATRLPDGLEISITDNGAGMPEKELSRLFEPYFTTKPKGLGLGLAISRTIVEDHGGQIEAAFNSDGGMTFRFTLPDRKAVRDA